MRVANHIRSDRLRNPWGFVRGRGEGNGIPARAIPATRAQRLIVSFLRITGVFGLLWLGSPGSFSTWVIFLITAE